MLKLLRDDARRLLASTQPSQFIARGIVPGTRPHHRCNFRHLYICTEPIAANGVSYRGTAHQDKIRASIRFPLKLQSGDISMVITTAHISPIMSLIAGVLILIMPRLLNLIVAIFLILNGLIGLGVLRWFHM
jgi:Protein of unknown function (DUF3096)